MLVAIDAECRGDFRRQIVEIFVDLDAPSQGARCPRLRRAGLADKGRGHRGSPNMPSRYSTISPVTADAATVSGEAR